MTPFLPLIWPILKDTVYPALTGGLGKKTGDKVTAIIDSVISGNSGSLDAKIQAQMATLNQSDQQQTALLAIDAKSGNWIQSLGRPIALWICNIGLLYVLLLQHLIDLAFQWAGKPVDMPQIDTTLLMMLLFALLGLSGVRQVEKQSIRNHDAKKYTWPDDA